MGPLSAVAVALVLFLYGLTLGAWATISAKVMAVIFVVVAIVVLLDAFVIGTGAHWTAWRTRTRQVSAPPQ